MTYIFTFSLSTEKSNLICCEESAFIPNPFFDYFSSFVGECSSSVLKAFYPLSLINFLVSVYVLPKSMFESILVASVIRRSVRPVVNTLTVELTLWPFSFINCAIRRSDFTSSFWHEGSWVNISEVDSSICIHDLSIFHGKVIEVDGCFFIAIWWLSN